MNSRERSSWSALVGHRASPALCVERRVGLLRAPSIVIGDHRVDVAARQAYRAAGFEFPVGGVNQHRGRDRRRGPPPPGQNFERFLHGISKLSAPAMLARPSSPAPAAGIAGRAALAIATATCAAKVELTGRSIGRTSVLARGMETAEHFALVIIGTSNHERISAGLTTGAR